MTQTVSLYDAAYTQGYNAALKDLKEKMRRESHIKEYRPAMNKRVKAETISYFVKQKLAGAVLMAASIIGLVVNEGDFAAALFTIPLSALIMLTGKRIFK